MEADAVLLLCGLILIVWSWIWLILQIMRNSPPLALAAVLFPLMTLWFAVQNWDLAWRPITMTAFGIALMIAGAWVHG